MGARQKTNLDGVVDLFEVLLLPVQLLVLVLNRRHAAATSLAALQVALCEQLLALLLVVVVVVEHRLLPLPAGGHGSPDKRMGLELWLLLASPFFLSPYTNVPCSLCRLIDGGMRWSPS